MSSRHQSRSLLAHIFPPMPRDYMLRRRRLRAISNVVVITFLSLLLAGAILYTSNPGAFSPHGR